MRINAGSFKGFSIATRPIPGTRPTSDKLKQVIFNVLGPAVQGKAVLDLFSGFGCLGLEALSRGARRVVFVESNPRCAKILQENLSHISGSHDASVMTQDVFKAIPRLEKQGEVFDIVLSDAPYDKDVHSKLLNTLLQSAILTEQSLLVFQHEKREQLFKIARAWKILQSYHHGNSSITLFRKET